MHVDSSAYSKAYSKGLYNEIFQSWNNECIEVSIRWIMAETKLEHGRPCCNLLDALAHSNLATWYPSWGKSPWLATKPPPAPCSSLPAHCLSAPGWLCFYLSMYPFLACRCSPARPVIQSPQFVLLAVPHPHCVPSFGSSLTTCPIRVRVIRIYRESLTSSSFMNDSFQALKTG
jgi:hypothetical protein